MTEWRIASRPGSADNPSETGGTRTHLILSLLGTHTANLFKIDGGQSLTSERHEDGNPRPTPQRSDYGRLFGEVGEQKATT